MVLLDVLEEHLSEAAFHWDQWERALVAPDFTLEEAAEQEERLRAHLEGLEEESAAEPVLRPAFESEEPPLISAAAHALLAQGAVDEVLRRLREAGPEARAAIRRALELSETPGLGAALLAELNRERPGPQAQVLEALAFRQEAPPELRARFLLHEEPRARAVALRGAPRLPEDTLRKLLPALLDSPHPDLRAAAMEAGLMAGLRLAWEACLKAVRTRAASSPGAMELLAVGGAEEDVRLLVERLEGPEPCPQALWALGFSGRVTAMEACLKQLAKPTRVGQLAGEAFSALTGLRLEGPYVLPPGERPEGAPPPPEEQEELDADLVPTPEDALPWPRASAITAWWDAARQRFEKGQRYLLGQPFSGPVLVGALEASPMRRRRVLALELALRTQGQLVIPTRAFTHRQREALARARSACTHLKGAPFAHTLR